MIAAMANSLRGMVVDDSGGRVPEDRMRPGGRLARVAIS
jgi:hypothetical protein